MKGESAKNAPCYVSVMGSRSKPVNKKKAQSSSTKSAERSPLHFSWFFRLINELEAQLDYERLRREKLEAQLDEYRREIAHLNAKMEELAVVDDVSRTYNLITNLQVVLHLASIFIYKILNNRAQKQYFGC